MTGEEVIPMTEIEIQQRYKACLDSVWTINDAIENPHHYKGDPDVIKRNVLHLEIMRVQDFWKDQDMTLIDAAIERGASFVAEGL